MTSETCQSKKELEDLVAGIFSKKEDFHRSQARLPIEEKIRILIELQKIAIVVRPRTQPGDRRIVWRLP